MTVIKLCGLSRECDIEAANKLKPDYIGFVFYKKSKRYVTPERAKELKSILSSDIKAVGVFIDEDVNEVARFLSEGIIDIAQLHGSEDEEYIKELRKLAEKPVFKAFKLKSEADIEDVEKCSADLVLLDSGAGTGKVFDWKLVHGIKRNYLLAGGLDSVNVKEALEVLSPYGVDVSSGIETDGLKDIEKMNAFVDAVRKE